MNKEMANEALEIADELGGFIFPSQIVIGGGFVRDMENGREIKDIDFIINAHTLSVIQHGKLNDWFIMNGYKQQSGAKAYTTQGTGGNTFMVYGDSSNTKKAQFILTKVPPLQFIEDTFDLGLCQVAMDFYGTIYKSKQYIRDVKNKRMTLMVRDTITPYQIGYAMKDHYPRLRQKYDWPLEVKWFDNTDAEYLCHMEKEA